MRLTWLDLENPDRRDLAGAVTVVEAARAADDPRSPSLSVSRWLARSRYGDDGVPQPAAVARTRSGGDRVVAVLELELPAWDNTHLGLVRVVVDPRHRRQGIGRELFEAGAARVRSLGRELILASCREQPGPVGFLTALGLTRAFVQSMQHLDLTALDWTGLDGLAADAWPAADGYELLRLAGPVPPELVDGVVALGGVINDAPTGELAVEDDVLSVPRLRGYEAALAAKRMRPYRVVARHRESGELVGHTLVEVDQERPGMATQLDTSVVRAHRGHRLGRLLKIEMLRWLAEAEPQLRGIDTDNAVDNQPMLRINQELGYAPYDTLLVWQRHR